MKYKKIQIVSLSWISALSLIPIPLLLLSQPYSNPSGISLSKLYSFQNDVSPPSAVLSLYTPGQGGRHPSVGEVAVDSFKLHQVGLDSLLKTSSLSSWMLIPWEHDPSGRDVELFRRHLYSGGKGPTVKGLKGAELADGLVIKEGDYKLVKTRFSAFFATHLDSVLKTLGIKNLVIVGDRKSVV